MVVVTREIEMRCVNRHTVATLLVALSISGCLALERPVMGHDRNPPSTDVEYKLSIVTFGVSKNVPQKEFVKGKTGNEDRMWMFWLVEGDGKKIVIDPGVATEEYAKKLKIENYVRPDVALQESGVSSGEVTHVLLTHFHAHSIEAVTLFPNAKFYIQSGALEWARMRINRREEKKRGINPGVISFLEDRENEGRLVRMDTTFELFKGLKVHAHYLHTRWYSYFSVNTADGVYVIPGIIAPYWYNIENNIGSPDCNERVIKRTYETMRVLSGRKTKHIIPALDPKITSEFEKVSEHIYRVAN